MNAQQIIETINQLPTGFTDRTATKAESIIAHIAERIAPTLEAKGLQISKGSTSPSGNKSFARIYLERAGNTQHNPNTNEYRTNVIKVWEWQTKSRYGYTPITAKAIIEFCSALADSVLE